ncbi:MAG: hypothetical protein PHV30_02825 [Candidatus Margulisbacteria bacterium]|nr:hypothetical protein [Candidatus Margulisiibacteriota bacterium]
MLIRLLFITALFMVNLAGAIPPGQTTSNATQKTGKVCILVYPSIAKTDLMNQLSDSLRDMNTQVVTDNLSNASAHPAVCYDAVILLSEVHAFGPMPEARDYIIKQKYASNIIYFSSYEKFNVPYGVIFESPDRNRIDAITAATKSAGQDKIKQIKEQILSNLKGLGL